LVECNFQSIHQNSKYFENPDQFLPERWLDAENASKIAQNFIPFSFGPRNCTKK